MQQIFKKFVKPKILFDFLDLYCKYEKNRYVINNITFRKYKFEEKIKPFFESLKEYYYPAKRFYLDRTTKYKEFITVIRQICKSNHVAFTSKINYCSSTYEISYFIYPEKS
tara:strand:+ start:538 stop:870 length:333 start_codon:yes stop_codon:yes gene_type:complete